MIQRSDVYGFHDLLIIDKILYFKNLTPQCESIIVTGYNVLSTQHQCQISNVTFLCAL